MEDKRLGKYDIIATVGRGAIGVVYEGWDPVLARKVAIKTLPLHGGDAGDMEKYERFKREAQAAARLHHPNIVSVYDYGETATHAYIVMEFLEGASLQAVLEKPERPSLQRIAAIMESLLAGLQHSHERGVVHRDIKPGNIVFSRDGEVKITDFGIAHLESSSMTQMGSIIGTPAYMAPEQVLGENVDARTDIYSSGVVLYEMLTGKRPFEGSTASIMHKIVNATPPRPSHLTPTLTSRMDTILEKVLAKTPDGRYQTAQTFARTLRDEFSRSCADPTIIMAHERGSAATGAAVVPEPRAGRGRLVAAVAGIVVVVAGGAWFLLQPEPHRVAGTAQPPVVASAAPKPAAPPPAPPVATPPAALAPPALVDAAPPPAPAPPPASSSPAPAAAPEPPLRRPLAGLVATMPCSLVGGDVNAGGDVTLTGVTGLGETSELEAEVGLRRAMAQAGKINSVTWTVRRFDGPYCGVLDVLRALPPRFGAPTPVGLALAAGTAHLADGDTIRLRVTMPDFPALVLIDHFTPDGKVAHLTAMPTDLARAHAALSVVTFAHGTADAARWGVHKPYGTDVIAVVASSLPLFEARRPDEEPASAYLDALAAALDRARGAGARLSADAIGIDTGPR